MSLSDHIVFWMRNNQWPELKPNQYVWTGQNGKIGQVRNHHSVSPDEYMKMFNKVRERMENAACYPSGLMHLLNNSE
jgi:hypothetical protein